MPSFGLSRFAQTCIVHPLTRLFEKKKKIQGRAAKQKPPISIHQNINAKVVSSAGRTANWCQRPICGSKKGWTQNKFRPFSMIAHSSISTVFPARHICTKCMQRMQTTTGFLIDASSTIWRQPMLGKCRRHDVPRELDMSIFNAIAEVAICTLSTTRRFSLHEKSHQFYESILRESHQIIVPKGLDLSSSRRARWAMNSRYCEWKLYEAKSADCEY